MFSQVAQPPPPPSSEETAKDPKKAEILMAEDRQDVHLNKSSTFVGSIVESLSMTRLLRSSSEFRIVLCLLEDRTRFPIHAFLDRPCTEVPC